jgi:hypothetical protein
MASETELKMLQAQNEQRRISKEELLTPKIVEREVRIESLDGTVKVRSLTFQQRQDLKQQAGVGTDRFDETNYVMLTIVESVVDPQLTLEDVEALRQQSGEIVDEISTQIMLINLIGRSGELKKGSSPTPSLDFPLNSQNGSE